MPENIVRKIFKAHLVEGSMIAGEEVSIRIDQTLTQDATGTMAYLQWESMGLDRVRTEASVSYVDHNTLQVGFENADDHRYLQSIAAKYGLYFSRPGNGICHQVHRERFAIPGKTMLGSDSHTPTAGAMGMIAIGVGGLNIACAMAGEAFTLAMPKVVKVNLTGKLRPFVTGKDIILEMLRRLTVKGGVGKVFEYVGPGLEHLSMGDRFTVTNMGAELGATTSLFASDNQTKRFMDAQGRGADWVELKPDEGASYDEEMEINLSELEPLVAEPLSPDHVKTVREVAGLPVAQACIGSCTNAALEDMQAAGQMLDNRVVHPNLSFTVTPGSKQVFDMTARDGSMARLIAAGARILESACGPCIGMGQAPPTGGISVRSFNRNFHARSGTMNDKVYLASVETCVASAIAGKLVDPRDLAEELGIAAPDKTMPDQFIINDNMIIPPLKDGSGVEIVRGPNIKPLPDFPPLEDTIDGRVALKVGDNISTDHILPAGAKILPFRSNIPAISEFCYVRVDEDFPARCKEWGGGIIVGASNYGQGSSREHAAISPKYLGIKAKIVKDYARIHRSNLINFGIVPLLFDNPSDYDTVEFGDELHITGLIEAVKTGDHVMVENRTKGSSFKALVKLTPKEREVLLLGGLLSYVKEHA